MKDWTWGLAGVSCCECDKLALVVIALGAQTGGGGGEPVEQPLLTEPYPPSER